jgi:hypothetical protein
MAKTSTVAKVSPIENGYKWAFSNGFEKTVTVADIPEELHSNFLLHGIKQKLSDAYANAQGNAETAAGLFQKVLDNILAGTWRTAKGEGEPRETPINLLAQAVANIQGKPVEGVLAILTAMDPAKRRKVRAIPEVAVELAKIKASATKPKETLESLLA